MTPGQRIAQFRKSLGLSQEALGEKVGVSRQSIYKWESDSALPEIEKLIALSRLFGISVGALLGVEEDAPAREEPAELTEAQLKMVEEITQRYLSALPQEPKHKRHPVLTALAILAVLFAAWQLYKKLDAVDRQYQSLTYQVQYVQRDVANQVDSISNRVENILEAQNAITADRETAIAATDLRAGLVTFSFRAVPKTFTASTLAYIEVNNEGTIQTFGPFAPQENQTFAGEVTTALTDSILLSVVFEDGGVRQTQLLDEYSGYCTASLPDVTVEDHNLWRITLGEAYVLELPSKHGEGQIVYTRPTSYDEAKQLSDNEPAAEIADIRIGLFKNQTLLAWAEPIEKPDNFHGFEDCSFYRFPDLRTDLAETDTLCVAALVTDTYGRTLFRHEGTFCPAEDGTTLVYVDEDPYTDNLEDWVFD